MGFVRCFVLWAVLFLPLATAGQSVSRSGVRAQRKAAPERPLALAPVPPAALLQGEALLPDGPNSPAVPATAADWFSRTGAGYAKQYGPGNIATLSLRGMGAAQTAVTWHGVPINSPMLGLVDLSLLPLSLFPEASLSRGGGQVRVGNAAIAGVLQLDGPERTPRTPGCRAALRLGTGSFGLLNGEAGASWSGPRFSASARAFGNRADNDFSFANTARPGAPEQRQVHAGYRHGGLIAETRWTHGRFRFDAAFWQQSAWRQVPPNMTQDTASAQQQDDASRLVLGTQLTGPKNAETLAVKIAYFRERLRYRDPAIGLQTDDVAHTFFGEVHGARAWGRHSANGQAQVWHEVVATDSYAGPAQRQRYALSGTFRTRFGKNLFLQTGLRLERSNFGWAPPLPSLLLQWSAPRAALALEGQIAYHYRIPTFNDLFWREAGARGNPALSPEQGWNAQIGAAFSPGPKGGAGPIGLVLRLYAQHTRRLIVWAPDGQGIWQPENAESVRSLGLELSQNARRHWGRFRLEQTASFQLAHAARLDSRNPLAEGRQMPHVPICQASAALRMGYRGCSLGYRHQFTARRFLTSTNTTALPAHHLGYFDAQADFPLKKTVLSVYLLLNNCWDAPYQLMEWRAMPGRHWEAGAKIRF
jgi:vitamin B12 transporter